MSIAIRFPYRSKQIDEGIIPDPTIEIEVLTVKGWRKFDFPQQEDGGLTKPSSIHSS